MDDLHSLRGALAMACIGIGTALFLLGLAEWIEHHEFKKRKEKQRQEF